jgi:hypothetical protein
MLLVPENKIFNNIVLIYKYLLRSRLTSAAIKRLPEKSHSYSEIVGDVKSFYVSIVGKCKNFINNIKQETPRVKNFLNNLSLIEKGERESVEGHGKESDCPNKISFDNISQEALLYLSIVSGHIPSKISKTGITFLTCSGSCLFAELLEHKNCYQERVKCFLLQAGAFGSPSKKDKGKEKWKEKKEIIERVLKAAVEDLGILHGIKLSTPSELSVDHNVIAEIKKIKF